MAAMKGLKRGDFWITIRRRVPGTGDKPGQFYPAEYLTTIEKRTGYLYEREGLVFGLYRQGPKLIEAVEILTGLRVLTGVTYAGTAEKLAEIDMSWYASIYRILAQMQDREDHDKLEPGMRTLGGDRVLQILELCQKRRPRV